MWTVSSLSAKGIPPGNEKGKNVGITLIENAFQQ
jgi:hypothetical protein